MGWSSRVPNLLFTQLNIPFHYDHSLQKIHRLLPLIKAMLQFLNLPLIKSTRSFKLSLKLFYLWPEISLFGLILFLKFLYDGRKLEVIFQCEFEVLFFLFLLKNHLGKNYFQLQVDNCLLFEQLLKFIVSFLDFIGFFLLLLQGSFKLIHAFFENCYAEQSIGVFFVFGIQQ